MRLANIFILFAVICSCQNKIDTQPVNLSDPAAYNNQTLFLDPSDIPDTLLPVAIDIDKRVQLQIELEMKLKAGSVNSHNFKKYSSVLFAYRDPLAKKLFREIIQDSSIHLFFRMLSMYSIGECGDKSDLTLLHSQLTNYNPLYREYAASAIIKLADSADLDSIRSKACTEQNAYVCKTLQSKKGDWTWISGNLPLYDTSSIKKELFFANGWSGYYQQFTYRQIDSIVKTPVAEHCIYPHQQYKVLRRLYEKINYPLISFGFEGDWGIHVGEDSGWLFSGLPVHAIMDGVVVKLQHESTWGCLLTIQSKLCDSSFVTTYYGHLSHKVNVAIGNVVSMGDKIGETALSFSLTNGGYLSHLHLGIEKATFKDALVKGWYDTDMHWYSPLAFVANYNKMCTP